ncbi:MAG TPA: twin-arginine translocase TatA/TatE family subunit [Dehalococcoidia bacterium]|nr:twin-arginine translocase TatA/TatE family subunit [Dehalococcoidia bacterium]
MVGLPSIGPLELILVLAIVFVIFGVGRLPEVGGAIGRALREFRRESAKTEEELARLKGKQEEKPLEEKKES